GEAIEVLINNAGVWGGEHQGLLDMDYPEWLRTLEINSVAPLRVTAALLPNLKRGKRPRVIAISSQMGSFAMKGAGMYAYRSSKAAVSKVMQTLAEELAPDGIIAVPVHPGWVQTDMGGPNAQLPAHDSVGGLIRLIENLRPEQSGRFWRWDGSEHPW
ncbi:MAG: SDR family NAD(P)-dependent oxidoreductase, partial [Pseudomonadota bacterium]|nr:SDR family NAD(P)-dependent oxidoreductase [Pseudomonadota bacterium]